MARDILSEYGPDKARHDAGRATNGGKMLVRDVRNYAAPQGPKGIVQSGPGLHGSNSGNVVRAQSHGAIRSRVCRMLS